jgi:hypothetical protein
MKNTVETRMDSARLRWLATLLVLPWAIGLGYVAAGPLGMGWNLLAPALGVALSLYFGHLLLFRMQCSLLEWLVGSILLASMEGLLLSTPGVLTNVGFVLLLAPMLCAWILFAMIRALVTARILKFEAAALRAAWIVVHVLLLLAPGAFIAGLGIYLGKDIPHLSGSEFTPFGMPLLVAGGVGLVINFFLNGRTKREARAALAEQAYAAGR